MKNTLRKRVTAVNVREILTDFKFIVNHQTQLFRVRAGSDALAEIDRLLDSQGLQPIPPDIAMSTTRIKGIGDVVYAPEFDDAQKGNTIEIFRVPL